MRVKMTLAYNGAYFEGFQYQAHTQNTVIGFLCKALNALGINETPIGSGRTDAKVHALRQVVHLDLPSFWNNLNHLKGMLNKYLNPTIHVRDIQQAPSSFHSRYDAISRQYRYIIYHNGCIPSLAGSVSFMAPFSIQRANQALKLLEGEHDFAFFKKEGSDIKNSKRNLFEAFCYKRENISIFSFRANGFLRSQVRLMVGVALAYAEEKLTYEQLQEQLECKAIHYKRPAPPEGLYLARIHYPL